jgi:hypothetical protein
MLGSLINSTYEILGGALVGKLLGRIGALTGEQAPAPAPL